MMSAAGLCSIFETRLRFAERKSLAPQPPEIKAGVKIGMVLQPASMTYDNCKL